MSNEFLCSQFLAVAASEFPDIRWECTPNGKEWWIDARWPELPHISAHGSYEEIGTEQLALAVCREIVESRFKSP